MYNRYDLSQKLNISEKELTTWMRHFGLKKRDTKAFDFTSEQKNFIRDNYHNHTHEQIAVKLCLSVTAVQGYCYRKGYKKYSLSRIVVPPKKRIIPVKTESKMVRPPAQYSNISREQHVDKWLNT